MQIEIYTSPLCGFCTIAKNLLLKKGVEFTEYDVLNDPSLKPVMLKRANGAHTVPQIFFNDHHWREQDLTSLVVWYSLSPK